MPSFKTSAAVIAGLAAVQASSYPHKNRQPVYAHFRSTLEDMDLAAGRNPFNGGAMGADDDINDILERLGRSGGGSATINGVPVEANDDGSYDPEIEELLRSFGGKGSFGRTGGRRNGGGSFEDPYAGLGGYGGRNGGRTGGSNPFSHGGDEGYGSAGGLDDGELEELLGRLGGRNGGRTGGRTGGSNPFNRGGDDEGYGSAGGLDEGELEELLGRLGGRNGGRTGGRTSGRTGGSNPFNHGGDDEGHGSAGGLDEGDLEELLGRLGGRNGGRTGGRTGGSNPFNHGGDDEGSDSAPATGRNGGFDEGSLEELLGRLGGRNGGGRNGGFEPQEPVSKGPLKMDNPEGSPFRIQVDYSTLNYPSERHVEYIKNYLMPGVVDFFQSTLKVKYPLKNNQRCPNYSNVNIPRKYITEGVSDADLVILIEAQNDPNVSWIAGAATLVGDARSGRSVLAHVEFNFGHINIDETDAMAISKNIYTTVHELTHVLGFSSDLFPKFLNPDGTKQSDNSLTVNLGGSRMTLLDVEPLTTRLKKHFNCDKIQGAPLEDDGDAGTAGSHFERRIFFNEYMTGSAMHDSRISEFSLALLEGTGWYVVDYSKAEPYTFGRGQGCDFFFGNCNDERGNPKFDDFCSKQDETECTLGRNGAAVCRIDSWSNGCGMPYAEEDYDCRNAAAGRMVGVLKNDQVFGADKGSKCFTGTIAEGRASRYQTAYCLNFKCNGTGASTALDVIIGKHTAKCTKKGKMAVEGLQGEFDCPDPVQFCKDNAPYCSKGCLGRGDCKEGICHCKPGFSGFDCSIPAMH